MIVKIKIKFKNYNLHNKLISVNLQIKILTIKIRQNNKTTKSYHKILDKIFLHYSYY